MASEWARSWAAAEHHGGRRASADVSGTGKGLASAVASPGASACSAPLAMPSDPWFPGPVPKSRLTGGINGVRLGGHVNALARPAKSGAKFRYRPTAQGGAAVRDPG